MCIRDSLTTTIAVGLTRPAEAAPRPAGAAHAAPDRAPAPGTATPRTTTLVALGDSWAAGTAAGGAALVDPAGADGTSCRRTVTSYPARSGPRLAPGSWTSRACASTTGGPNTQFSALTPAVTRVTITVGADATGLGALAAACAAGAPRGACDAAAARTGQALDALPRALDASLAEIHRRVPGARLLLTTYPRLSEGLACPAGAADPAAARRVDTAVTRLDGILVDRARAAGVAVVDVRAVFTGHSACAAQPWITRFAGTDPLRTGAPDASGQAAIAAAVDAAAARPAAVTTPRPVTTTAAPPLLRVAPGPLLGPLFPG